MQGPLTEVGSGPLGQVMVMEVPSPGKHMVYIPPEGAYVRPPLPQQVSQGMSAGGGGGGMNKMQMNDWGPVGPQPKMGKMGKAKLKAKGKAKGASIQGMVATKPEGKGEGVHIVKPRRTRVMYVVFLRFSGIFLVQLFY